MKVLSYLKARANERSTWMLFGAAIATASALPMPWAAASIVVGLIGALVPDGPVKP